MHYDIINLHAIEQFLQRPCGRLTGLLVQILGRALRRERAALRLVRTYPADAPPWLTPARFAQETYYRWVGPNVAIRRKVDCVETWLSAALKADAAWLRDTYPDGRVRKLANIGTLDHAHALARKELAAAGFSEFAGASQKRSRIVLTNADGTSWVSLVSRRALREEARRMRHCLGRSHYAAALEASSAAFYSLRDPTGKSSFVTVQAVAGHVRAAKGFANCDPRGFEAAIRSLCDYLQDQILADVSPPHHGDEWWNERPTIHHGDWQLAEQPGFVRMPRHLHVLGSLDLSGSTGGVMLPDVLFVDGNLNLARSKVASVPRWLRVRGDIDLSGSDIPALPCQLLAEGSLNLADCAALQELPPHMIVVGWLTLRGCGVKHIPPAVNVGEGVGFDRISYVSTEDANRYLRGEGYVAFRAGQNR